MPAIGLSPPAVSTTYLVVFAAPPAGVVLVCTRFPSASYTCSTFEPSAESPTRGGFDRAFSEWADACQDAWRQVLGLVDRITVTDSH